MFLRIITQLNINKFHVYPKNQTCHKNSPFLMPSDFVCVREDGRAEPVHNLFLSHKHGKHFATI